MPNRPHVAISSLACTYRLDHFKSNKRYIGRSMFLKKDIGRAQPHLESRSDQPERVPTGSAWVGWEKIIELWRHYTTLHQCYVLPHELSSRMHPWGRIKRTHLSTRTPKIPLELDIVPPLLDTAFVSPIYLLCRNSYAPELLPPPVLHPRCDI
jgi:hypothetical protein